jgi:mannose-1-phosphate guanylyltransferase
MLAVGNYLWNAGIFLFRTKDITNEFTIHASEIHSLVSPPVNNVSLGLGFLCLSEETWSNFEDVRIDYAIMEKAQNLGAEHRSVNNEKMELILIKTQIDGYSGEDYIIYYSDTYSRV